MRIRINDTEDLDELSISLQKILAYLADNGVHSGERVNLYITPRKPSGNEARLPPEELDDFEIIADKPPTSRKGSRSGGKSTRPAPAYKKRK